MKLKAFLLCLAFVPGFVVAQEPYKALPGAVVIHLRVAEVPPDWKTNDSRPDLTENVLPSAPERFVIGRKDKMVYQRLDFKQGRPEEAWWIDGWLGWKDRRGELFLFDASKPIIDGPNPEFFQHPPKLPGLWWLEAGLRVAPANEKAAKSKALRYYATGEDGPSPAVLRAWIDDASGTPVAAQKGRLFLLYRFGGNIPVPDFPIELAEKLKAQKKVKSFIETMRNRRKNETALQPGSGM